MEQMSAARERILSGLPPGTLDLADRLVGEADRQLQALTGARLPSDPDWPRRQLSLPAEVENDWPGPKVPLPVRDGAVHVDLIPEDAAAFTRLCESEAGWEPEALAAAAQSWRLPVTPYRAPHCRWVGDDLPPDLSVRHRRRPETLRVLDLSVLWAGPLATGLLQAAGIRVIKLDPSCRPDGFRRRPALYQRLNRGKTRVDLDLRRKPDRESFEALVAEADLVVDSFHRRVMPNLGYAPEELRRLKPEIATLSITAFPPRSPERDWLAYGGGVHAASGLGSLAGRASPAPIAYPDALTGLRAFGVALSLLGGSGARPHVELSLLGSIVPLLTPVEES